MIAKVKLYTTLFGKQSYSHYELVRSKHDSKEVHIISTADHMGKGRKVEKYRTEKTNKEIKEFALEKEKEYQDMMNRKLFIFSPMVFSKFEGAFDQFFEEYLGNELELR